MRRDGLREPSSYACGRIGRRGRFAGGRGLGTNGLTLIEVLVAFSAVLIALLAFTRVILASMAATTASHEATVAEEGAQRMIETLQDQPFATVFALFNGDPQDDPGGVGTAPGKNFVVADLQVRRNDPDGFAGEVRFPTPAGAPGVLREDLPDRAFGTPRDLSGEGDIDAQDHAADYGLLPVAVRVEYRLTSGQSGRVELRTLLGNIQ